MKDLVGEESNIYFRTNGFWPQILILLCFNQNYSQAPRYIYPTGLVRITSEAHGRQRTPVTESSLPFDWQQQAVFLIDILYPPGVSGYYRVTF